MNRIALCYPKEMKESDEVVEMRSFLEVLTSSDGSPLLFSEYFSTHPGLVIGDIFYLYEDGRWRRELYRYLSESKGS